MPRSHAAAVDKALRLGSRGGIFYVNTVGRRVYLKRYQRVQCLQKHELPGDANRACQKLIAREAAERGVAFVPRYGHVVKK